MSGSFPAGTTTSAYNGSAAGVGGVPPYSYTASGIPQGLNFAGGTLTGQAKNPGTDTIGVQVTDSKGVSVSGSFSFTITGPAPTVLTIATTSLPDGLVGQPYSQSLSAVGGTPGYTWSLTGGQLPTGLSLNGSGTVAGIPTDPGLFTYNLGVQVTDTSGAQAIGTVSINIDPAPLMITNGAVFPAGQVGVDYPAQILTASRQNAALHVQHYRRLAARGSHTFQRFDRRNAFGGGTFRFHTHRHGFSRDTAPRQPWA